jgi:hypothetical protein
VSKVDDENSNDSRRSRAFCIVARDHLSDQHGASRLSLPNAEA